MDYFQLSGQRQKGTEIILEPDEWTESQWAAFLDLFDLVEADRIVLADYVVEVYGTPKTEAT